MLAMAREDTTRRLEAGERIHETLRELCRIARAPEDRPVSHSVCVPGNDMTVTEMTVLIREHLYRCVPADCC